MFNHFSQYFFFVALVSLAFSMKTLVFIPALLFLKFTTQILVLNRASKRLGERDLLAGSLVYELILLFIYPIFHITKLFYKQPKWTN